MIKNNINSKYRSIIIPSIFIGIIFIFFQGCKKEHYEDNFIFITLDTQRADYISAYGQGFASTPNMDSVADKGILYENCYALIPITLPSHASMFFSQPPHELKNYNNGQEIKPKKRRPSFVNLLSKNGIQTAAFISLGVMGKKFGLNEGFDLYDDIPHPKRWYLTAGEVNKKVFKWLDENNQNRFFLWVHYSDPHDPYSPPDMPNDFKVSFDDEVLLDICLRKYENHVLNFKLKKGKNILRFEINNPYITKEEEFLGKLDAMEFSPPHNPGDVDIEMTRGWFIKREKNKFFFKNNSIIEIYNHGAPRDMSFTFKGGPLLKKNGVRELYKKEVEYMDGEIGKLLSKIEEVNLSGKTKIMILGDHGEGLGEYKNKVGDDHFGHIHFLKKGYMKVPLILYDPHRSGKGSRVNDFVTPLDVAPTVLNMMDVKLYDSFQGKDLRKKRGKNEAGIYMETYRDQAIMNRFAVLDYPWHLIFIPKERRYELYNLKKDPGETQNVFDPGDLPGKVKKMKTGLDTFTRDVLLNKVDVKIDEKELEMLKSLGYIK